MSKPKYIFTYREKNIPYSGTISDQLRPFLLKKSDMKKKFFWPARGLFIVFFYPHKKKTDFYKKKARQA